MKGTEEQPERADVREEMQRKKEMLERYVRNLPGPVMVAFSGVFVYSGKYREREKVRN